MCDYYTILCCSNVLFIHFCNFRASVMMAAYYTLDTNSLKSNSIRPSRCQLSSAPESNNLLMVVYIVYIHSCMGEYPTFRVVVFANDNLVRCGWKRGWHWVVRWQWNLHAIIVIIRSLEKKKYVGEKKRQVVSYGTDTSQDASSRILFGSLTSSISCT